MEKSEDETNTDNNAYNSIRNDTIDESIYMPNSSCKGIGNWTQKNSPLPCSKTDFTRMIRRKGMYLKKVLHRCISHSIPKIKLSLRILLTSRKPTQPLWAQGWCWGWHSTRSLVPGLHLHLHLLLHLLQLQPLLPVLRPCQAHGVVADAVGKDCKILFKAHISTWLEKLWGCCWMVTVMFSCQELPGWSVPGLLFAFLIWAHYFQWLDWLQ